MSTAIIPNQSAQVDRVPLFNPSVSRNMDHPPDIEFRTPPSVKPGRLQLLVKTTGKQPLLAVGITAVTDGGDLDGFLVRGIEEDPVVTAAQPESR